MEATYTISAVFEGKIFKEITSNMTEDSFLKEGQKYGWSKKRIEKLVYAKSRGFCRMTTTKYNVEKNFPEGWKASKRPVKPIVQEQVKPIRLAPYTETIHDIDTVIEKLREGGILYRCWKSRPHLSKLDVGPFCYLVHDDLISKMCIMGIIEYATYDDDKPLMVYEPDLYILTKVFLQVSKANS